MGWPLPPKLKRGYLGYLAFVRIHLNIIFNVLLLCVIVTSIIYMSGYYYKRCRGALQLDTTIWQVFQSIFLERVILISFFPQETA